MSLLSRHVSVLKSEEFVLGVSGGFRGEAGSRFASIESTKLCVVAKPSSKNYTGYTSIDQKIGDASIGEAMKDKQFPARCLITYERRTDSKTQSYEGKESSKDIEVLVVIGIEYLSPCDLVDIKIPSQKQKEAA